MKPSISVATIGHIDHGKSTLLGRLLYDSDQVPPEKKAEVAAAGGKFAYYLDAFEEERQQGITIDVVYARYESPKYIYNFIDDPGHREFIKNMLTGASQASGVILVVSAKEDEQIQEQTKRHLNLIHLLGIKQILVVINKMDLAGYKQGVYERVTNRVGPLIKGPTLCVPTSAQEGDNVYHRSERMSWYTGPTFAEALDQASSPPEPPVDKPLRGLVQKVFARSLRSDPLLRSAKGSDLPNCAEKALIVTKIVSGTAKAGEKVYFPLADIETTVTGIDSLGKEAEIATVGESVGIQIDQDPAQIERGDVLCPPPAGGQAPTPTTAASGKLFVISQQPITRKETLGFRCGTREVECQIEAIQQRIDSETGEILEENADQLQSADFALVTLKTDQPVITESAEQTPELGRFILTKNGLPLAVGVITPLPPSHLIPPDQ